MFIPEAGSDFFHPLSLIQGCQYPGSRIRIRIKECMYFLTQKTDTKFSRSEMFNPVPRSRILALDFLYPGSGSRGQKSTRSRIPNPDSQHCVLQLMTKSKLVHQPPLIYYKELQWYDKQIQKFYTFLTIMFKPKKIPLISKNSTYSKTTPRLYL
jgi:hypothetical protein